MQYYVTYTYVYKPRNSETWSYKTAQLPIFQRGYTGHEHLAVFGLINMNYRLYDPVNARFISSDNLIPNITNTQSYNLYSYVLNNPLKYTDPDGHFPWLVALAAYWLFFTESGYETQKLFSPVAFKVDWHLGTHKIGLGFDMSIGVPTILPASYRYNFGYTYFSKTYGNYSGWEHREGTQYSFGLFGLNYTHETRNYTFNTSDGEFNQKIGITSYGWRSIADVQLSNDMSDGRVMGGGGDGGDRWRTAAVQLNFFVFSAGMNLFTGDPGDPNKQSGTPGSRDVVKYEDGHQYYSQTPYVNPDKYRNGILYLGIGSFQFGWDAEANRHVFQNEIVHDPKGIPRFKVTNKKDAFYFQAGSGGIW